MVVLLGVTLTATAFTWRQHVSVERASGKELIGLSPEDYPGARALTAHVRVPTLRIRPTIMEIKDDIPATTRDGCISDFVNPAVVNCTYGDRDASRTIALAGGSHAEHWLPALDLLGQHAPLQSGDVPQNGLPVIHRAGPADHGQQRPLPAVPRVGATDDGQAGHRPSRLRIHHVDPAVEHQTR